MAEEGQPCQREPLEVRVDKVEVSIILGQWRGSRRVGELQPGNPQSGAVFQLFAQDDEEALPWGRSLEELLTVLIDKATGAEEPG